jgi:hypothetical protein
MQKEFKTPDKKAPRFRQTTIGLLNKDFHARFLKKFPQYKGISDKQMKEIIELFNGKLWQAIIDNRDGVELPEGLGNIFIGSCKTPHKENVDYNTSAKLGIRVINRNLGSDGYLAKILYTNHEARFKFRHRKLWKFKGARQFTNAASITYKEDWPKYMVVEDLMKISSLFRETRRRQAKKIRLDSRPIPEHYNEFDLD